MFCKYCGTEGPEHSYCSNCGQIIGGEEQTRYSEDISVQAKIEEDKSEVLYNLISFFIPIVGLVFFFIWKDEYPIRAKACLKWMIISVVLSVLLSILFVIGFISLATFINTSGIY